MKIVIAFVAGAVTALVIIITAVGKFTDHMWKD